MSSPADPLAPVPVNVRRIVLATTALWAVALVVSLVLWSHIDHVIVWTCLAGTVLGLVGYAQIARHRRMGRTV